MAADLAAIAAAMERGRNDGVSSSDDDDRPQLELLNMVKAAKDRQPDEDFGDILKLPFPDDILDYTFKGDKIENIYLGQYDESECKTCAVPCYNWMKSNYNLQFTLSRVTMEDQGKFLNVTGLEFFPFDDAQLTDSMLFRKDGKYTPQPPRTRIDNDGVAKFITQEFVCILKLEGRGISLKKIDAVTEEEVVDCFIEYKKDEYKKGEKQLVIDNNRSRKGVKSQVVGTYTLASWKDQKNKAYIEEFTLEDSRKSLRKTILG